MTFFESQHLTHNLTTSNHPNFENNSFEEKVSNGWLRYYYQAVIVFFFTNLAYLVANFLIGLHYLRSPSKIRYASTFLYVVSLVLLAAVALTLAVSLLLQHQAIRLRSLDKQNSCIKAIVIFLITQTCALLFNDLSPVAPRSVNVAVVIAYSLIPLGFGASFLFIALKVKSIMLGKERSILELSKSAFQVPNEV